MRFSMQQKWADKFLELLPICNIQVQELWVIWLPWWKELNIWDIFGFFLRDYNSQEFLWTWTKFGKNFVTGSRNVHGKGPVCKWDRTSDKHQLILCDILLAIRGEFTYANQNFTYITRSLLGSYKIIFLWSEVELKGNFQLTNQSSSHSRYESNFI